MTDEVRKLAEQAQQAAAAQADELIDRAEVIETINDLLAKPHLKLVLVLGLEATPGGPGPAVTSFVNGQAGILSLACVFSQVGQHITEAIDNFPDAVRGHPKVAQLHLLARAAQAFRSPSDA